MSNHLLVQLQRQHILLSYFKTLSVGPVWGPNPRPPAQQTGALPTELTRRRYSAINDLSFSLQKLPQKHNSGYKDVRMQGRIMVTLKKIQLGALVFMYFFEEMVS